MMRILYFSNIPISKNEQGGYNGGGWIYSLIDEMKKLPAVHVAVGFFGQYDEEFEVDGLSCYRIKTYNGGSFLKKVVNHVRFMICNCRTLERRSWPYYENRLLRVVNDYKPDIIHIFGSEMQWGLLAGVTDVPVILHIQGILNPYYNALFPPFMGWGTGGCSPIALYRRCFLKRQWESRCCREREIFKRVHYYIGRTKWDERVTYCLNPEAKYYYGSEILRDVFYEPVNRTLPESFAIVSTISSPTYKGLDMILKTAYILKYLLDAEFSWHVYGVDSASLMERITGIKSSNVNVQLMGVADSKTVRKSILSCTCYMHPSYIDNSPNSLCEAQILGVPVVACDVGGLSSLIENNETGLLVPANDPYQAAYFILNLGRDIEYNIRIGNQARIMAMKRHDKGKIISNILSSYNSIISESR